MNRLKIIKKIFAICFSITLCFEYFYYNRLLIPFEYIQPNVTWRTYDMQIKYNNEKYKRNIFEKNIQNRLKNKTWVIEKNSYPYYTDSDHYVLWRDKFKNHDVNKLIHDTFDQKIYKTKWFENPEYMKSVKRICHVHVFVKQK